MSKNQNNTTSGTIALAALVGGAAGAFISLMLAPKSGKALRQDIKNKAETIIEQVEDSTIQRAETIKQRSTDLVEKGKKLKEDIQIFVKDLRIKKPDYINISQSASEETSPPPEPEPNFTEVEPNDVPFHDEEPILY